MELDSALGQIQSRSDLLIRKIAREAIQHFFFTGCEPDLAVKGFSGMEQLGRLLVQPLQLVFFERNEHGVVSW